MEDVKEEVSEIEQRLRNELNRLSIPSLREWLGRQGYESSEDVTKSDLIEAIMTIETAKVRESEKTTEQATALADEDDPIVEMVFENLESKGVDIEFTFARGGFKKNDKGKVIPLPKYHFYPGRTYRVPLSVVDHLNSLRVPSDKTVNADDDGFIQSLHNGDKQNRFSCRVTLTKDQRSRLKGALQ